MANKTRETANLVSSKTGIAVTISGDPVILGVGNTQHLRVTGGGQIGVGKNPGKILDLQASEGLAIRYYDGTSTFRAGLEVATIPGQMVGTSGTHDFCIRSQSNILFSAGGNTERLHITSDGDFYLNRTSQLSDAKLSVQADAGEPLIAAQMDTNSGISTVLQTFNSSGNVSSNISVDNANRSLILKGASTEGLRIDSTGKISQGGHTASYEYDLRGTGQQTILVGSENAGGAALILDGDSDGDGSGTDYASILHSSDGNIEINNRKSADIIFKNTSSGTERLRIRSDGKIGFGTDLTNASGITYSFVHPTAGSAGNAAILQVATHADSTLYLSLGTKEITAGSGGDGISYIRAGSSTSLNNTLIFETAVAGTETEQMRLDGTTSGITSVHIGDYANAVASSGFISKQHNTPWEMTISASRSSTTPRALIFNSHLTQEVARFTNDSSPYFRLSSNCAGIQFNGDTDAVDTLDYYEEGTWLPDLHFDDAKTGISYGSGDRYGTYTRIGNIVFCRFMFALSSKGTATGAARIYGLPFTIANKLDATSLEGEGGITYFDNKGAESGIPYIIPWQGTTYARMYRMFEGANADSSAGSEAIFEDSSSCRGYFWYYV